MKIAFKKGITPWDWAIRLFSGGPFSHCEIIFSDGTWFSSRPGRGVSYKPSRNGNYTFIDLRVSKEAEENLRKWANTEIGCKYDWMGIIWFLFKRAKPHPDRWFCSEICTAALQQTGMLIGVEPHTVTPMELYILCGRLK